MKLKKEIVKSVGCLEYDLETGEVLSEYEKNIYDGEAVAENKQIRKSRNELHIHLRNNDFGHFFFYFYDKFKDVDIKDQYKMRFIHLASYVDYDSDYLVYMQGRNKVKMDKKKVKEIVNVSNVEFINTMKIFIENNLVKVDEDGYYRVNTTYCMKGENKSVDSGCTRVFFTLRELYSMTEAKSHKVLYYFFKLLPYVNLQYNLITYDVECENPKEVKPITMTEICDLIGISSTQPKRTYEMLRKFKIKEEYVFARTIIGDTEIFVINPKLYYKGTRIESVKYIEFLFDIAKGCSERKAKSKK